MCVYTSTCNANEITKQNTFLNSCHDLEIQQTLTFGILGLQLITQELIIVSMLTSKFTLLYSPHQSHIS